MERPSTPPYDPTMRAPCGPPGAYSDSESGEEDPEAVAYAALIRAAMSGQRAPQAAPPTVTTFDGHLPCAVGDLLCRGGFRVEAQLGRGESSTVFLATSVPGGTSVALKVFRCDPALRDSVQYERRIDEYLSRRCRIPMSPSRGAVTKPTGAASAAVPTTARAASSRTPAPLVQASFAAKVQGLGTRRPLRLAAPPSQPADRSVIAALRGYTTHDGPFGVHEVLLFDPLGASLDWLMGLFGFTGIPHPGLVGAVLRSALQGLRAIEASHVVHTDVKPENLLFGPTNKSELETVVKALCEAPIQWRSARRFVGSELFHVYLIDFGLSFLLPPRLRAPSRMDRAVQVVRSQGSSSQRSSTQRATSRAAGAETPRPRSSSQAAVLTRTAPVDPEETELLRMSNYTRGVRIQTREYRAPEIIWGTDFGSAADIWSIGCIAFELVTGRFLCDPKRFLSDDERSLLRDDVLESGLDRLHILEIKSLCGPPPPESASGVYGGNFWLNGALSLQCRCPSAGKGTTLCGTCGGVLVVPRELLQLRSLEAELAPTMSGDAVAAAAFASLIRGCIRWEPHLRATAAQLLLHPWLNEGGR